MTYLCDTLQMPPLPFGNHRVLCLWDTKSMSAGIMELWNYVVYYLFQTVPWNRTDALQIHLIFSPIKKVSVNLF